MAEVTFVACDACFGGGEIELPRHDSRGPLACPNCNALIRVISVAPWQSAIERRVHDFAVRHRSGTLGSRKQDLDRSDAEIDRCGLQAELAACLLLCPGQRRRWIAAQGPNRGNDLPSQWTGLSKPVEVKQTRVCDERRGYLIIRPPRRTPGPMRAAYIDDSLYVLLCGQQGLFSLLGWTDREHLLTAGRLNPVPVRPGQRACWGIHWQRLYPIAALYAADPTLSLSKASIPCTTPCSAPFAPQVL